MKESILTELKAVKSVCKDLKGLQDKFDQFGKFNYYYDYLEFINWLKATHPAIEEEYNLDMHFDTLDSFGVTYIKLIKPKPTPITYDDDIIGIGLPINEMISQVYDYVVSLPSDNDFSKILQDVIEESKRNTKALLEKVEQVDVKQNDLAIKVKEVHAVHTGKLIRTTERKPHKTKKQLHEDEIAEMCRMAELRTMNR